MATTTSSDGGTPASAAAGAAAGGFAAAPEAVLAARLGALGLVGVERIRTHANRTVMLSLSRGTLRIHRGYAQAPDRVLRAIVRFLAPHVPRALRRVAQREFLAFPVEEHAPPRPAPERPGDVAVLARLRDSHRRLNDLHFGGTLGEIPIRLSGRMRTRLGELSADRRNGRPIEIAISRRHVARHPWAEVEHTLLHEMVHQWQAESGLPLDHGTGFRRKAREVGILARARRPVGRGVETTDTIRTAARAP